MKRQRLHVATLLLLLLADTLVQTSAKTFQNEAIERHQQHGCPRPQRTPQSLVGGGGRTSQQQRLAIDEWSNTVPATILSPDKPALMVANDVRMRYVIHLAETDPLSIVVTPSCRPPSGTGEIRWTVVFNETEILGTFNALNRSSFELSCATRGIYHVWVESKDCTAEIYYNTRSLVDLWPMLNRTLSPIKIHQHPRRQQFLVKWEKSKFDIHAMHYCLVVSRERPQRTLCQALANSQFGTRCGMSTFEILQRMSVEEEKKIPQDVITTIACTSSRTKQMIRGLKPNTTYFLDVFAIHTHKQNLSYLLGTTIIHVNRTRPTQLIESKLAVGKLSTLGGLALFSFKIPKKSPKNTTLKLMVTPCIGTVNVEIFRKKRQAIKPIVDVYYPRVITIEHAVPGERYQIQITEADEHYRTNRIQIVASTKDEFLNMPQLPDNTTVVEVTQLRTCHATTIAWYSSPDKRKIRYCTYIFKQHTKHQHYSNVKMPSYCELENRDIFQHPQLQQTHCIFSDQINHTEPVPMSMSISNLAPAHYYLIFVTASLGGSGGSLPYRSARVKTHPYCRENAQPINTNAPGKSQQLRTIPFAKKQQPRGHLKGGGSHHQKALPQERRNNRLKRNHQNGEANDGDGKDRR